LFRHAAEDQSIEDVDVWMEYYAASDEAVHTYDEKTAENVFLAAKRFLYDVRKFIKKPKGLALFAMC